MGIGAGPVASAAAELPATTIEEEIANSLTGALGLLASLLGLVILSSLGWRSGELEYLISGGVYGVTLVLLYVTTTLYHGARRPPTKRVLRLIDHCAVYLLIAGTYTPVAIAGLGGRTGWISLAVAWSLALLGIVFKLTCRFRYPGTSVTLYIVMGWLGLAMVGPVVDALPAEAMLWLVAGGLAYTVGTIFFGAKRMRYNHAVWHAFVIAGSASHYLAITRYVLTAA